MRIHRPFAVSVALLSAAAALLLALPGCAHRKGAACTGDNAAVDRSHGKKGMPHEVGVTLQLVEGAAWKARYVSTGEVRRVLKGADGVETVRSRSLGLELVAVQTVRSVKDGKARIEVAESSAKILQEGKFVDAPFRRLAPPEKVFFTVDTATGKVDFSEMEKAWRDWMATVKDGPAGDILGKTFRLEGYLSQLEDIYAKPFTRLAGRKLTKEYRSVEEKEFLLPFVGPSVDLGPMPVRTDLAYTGFHVRKGVHLLDAAGRYAGEGALTAAQLGERLEEFGVKAPAAFESKTSASGQFQSGVDVLSGRELQTDSRVTYEARATFGGSTLSEEIAAKYLVIPEE